MSLKVKYTLSWENGPDHMKRKFAAQVAESLEAIGNWWFRFRLPLHFAVDGPSEYGFAERAKRYKKKRQILERLGSSKVGELQGITNPKKGKQRGTLMRTVKRAGTIRATSKRLTVTMPAPSYVNYRSRSGQGPDKVAEITAISPKEQKQIPEIFERRVSRLINTEKTKTVHRHES